MRIFFGDKCFVIGVEHLDEGLIVEIEGEYALSLDRLLSLFEGAEVVGVRCQSEAEVERLFDSFARQFVAVVAGGGVVEACGGELLMIERNGRWDLPKGHWEEGESLEECALREVEEECGITSLTLVSPLCQTLHAYCMRGRWELKRTHWYRMRGDKELPLTPQREEGIERVEWVDRDSLPRLLEGSFPTIRLVAESFCRDASLD